MNPINPIYIGNNAIDELIAYCNHHGLKRLTLVADDNTYAALGQRVEAALQAQAFDLTSIVLHGEEIIADEQHLIRVLANAPVADQTFIAVGSGTITDITRFVSHRSRNPFLSIPTAPSVDGFTSIGAPLVLDGLKQTIISQPPLAVFADLPTLQAAPRPLIAAGFGDMLGKITSLADWKLGALLWDEPYDEAIAQRAQAALDGCIHHVDAIAAGDDTGIRHLMDSLIDSGLCMLEFGSSRPASGAEHHASHYWEMMLLRAGRPAILHGAKVGVATIQIATLYNRLALISPEQSHDVLANATLPDRQRETETIQAAYGPAAEAIIAGQTDFLNMSQADFDALKSRIERHWDEILAIANTVPESKQIAADARHKVGGPTSGQDLGLDPNETVQGFAYGHYLRNRFHNFQAVSFAGAGLRGFQPQRDYIHAPIFSRISLGSDGLNSTSSAPICRIYCGLRTLAPALCITTGILHTSGSPFQLHTHIATGHARHHVIQDDNVRLATVLTMSMPSAPFVATRV